MEYNSNKQIIMLQGMGHNDRTWAKNLSLYCKVILIQQPLITHVEIWDNGVCIYNGSDIKNPYIIHTIDDILFGFITVCKYIYLICKYSKCKKSSLIIAINYCGGIASLFLKMIGMTNKVVVFVTDYLPPTGSFIIKTHRYITTKLTRFVCKFADEVWKVSPRIILPKSNDFVVPLHIDNTDIPITTRNEICYMGSISMEHGLDILFKICKKHNFKLNIIGDSPNLQSIKHLAPTNTIFHGMLNDSDKINSIVSRCFCGYAIYTNIDSTTSCYYGFPSKTLYYLSNNTPILTSKCTYFSNVIKAYNIGNVVAPNFSDIEYGILNLEKNSSIFNNNINIFKEIWTVGVDEFNREHLTKLLT